MAEKDYKLIIASNKEWTYWAIYYGDKVPVLADGYFTQDSPSSSVSRYWGSYAKNTIVHQERTNKSERYALRAARIKLKEIIAREASPQYSHYSFDGLRRWSPR